MGHCTKKKGDENKEDTQRNAGDGTNRGAQRGLSAATTSREVSPVGCGSLQGTVCETRTRVGAKRGQTMEQREGAEEKDLA